MAFRTPAIQNENSRIRIGKDADALKVALPKPAKSGRQDRKALKDLSNTGKPLPSGPSKAPTLKEKSVQRGQETIKNSVKNNFLTDEELKRCHEWAKEGIERAHFTGNDLQKLQKETEEERINKKVRKAMSNLHEGLHASYELRMPKAELSEETKNLKMQLEIEVLPSANKPQTSGDKEIDDLLEVEDWCLEQPFKLEVEQKEDEDVDSVQYGLLGLKTDVARESILDSL